MGMWTTNNTKWLPFTVVLDDTDHVPEIIKNEIQEMKGFDGCECQSLEWGIHIISGEWYSRKQGCGNGMEWLDRKIDTDGNLCEIHISGDTPEYDAIVSACLWELRMERDYYDLLKEVYEE